MVYNGSATSVILPSLWSYFLKDGATFKFSVFPIIKVHVQYQTWNAAATVALECNEQTSIFDLRGQVYNTLRRTTLSAVLGSHLARLIMPQNMFHLHLEVKNFERPLWDRFNIKDYLAKGANVLMLVATNRDMPLGDGEHKVLVDKWFVAPTNAIESCKLARENLNWNRIVVSQTEQVNEHGVASFDALPDESQSTEWSGEDTPRSSQDSESESRATRVDEQDCAVYMERSFEGERLNRLNESKPGFVLLESELREALESANRAPAHKDVASSMRGSFGQQMNVDATKVRDSRRQGQALDKGPARVEDLEKLRNNFKPASQIASDLVPILTKYKAKQDKISCAAQNHAERRAVLTKEVAAIESIGEVLGAFDRHMGFEAKTFVIDVEDQCDHSNQCTAGGSHNSSVGVPELNTPEEEHRKIQTTPRNTQPNIHGGRGKKPRAHAVDEFCAYWVLTGECCAKLRGCPYVHKMPSLSLLREMGLERYPIWFLKASEIETYAKGTGPEYMQHIPALQPGRLQIIQTIHTSGVRFGNEIKVYCFPWIVDGHCDVDNGNCKLAHELPSWSQLSLMGFQDYPQWYRGRQEKQSETQVGVVSSPRARK